MSLLLDPECHPLRPAQAARDLGATAVLAPHPDDESLGCGGLLALLADAGLRPRVLVVTDGCRSHPNSAAYPAPRLRGLRMDEARAAVAALGLHPDALTFLGHEDCGLPDEGTPAFAEAARQLAEALRGVETVVVPWRRDPHCDHVGTWALACAAVALLDEPPRWIEYPVWAWPNATTDAAPQDGEARAWRLDIADVLDRKRAAIAAHRSQTTPLIDDDPDGFRLSADVLAHFERPWELFLEPRRPCRPAPLPCD